MVDLSSFVTLSENAAKTGLEITTANTGSALTNSVYIAQNSGINTQQIFNVKLTQTCAYTDVNYSYDSAAVMDL